MDETQQGLGVEVRPNGRRVWIFRGQASGRRKIQVIGDYPDVSLTRARALVRERWAALQNGTIDPVPAAPSAGLTFGGLVDAFLRDHGPSRAHKTVLMYKTALLKHAAPFHELPAADVSVAAVEDLHAELSARSPTAANRVVAVLSKVFSWGARRRLLPAGSHNPASGVEKTHEAPRSRVLSDSELRQVWREAALEGPIYSAVIRLLILTGCRLSEIAAARWSEIESIQLDGLGTAGARRTALRIAADRMKARREHVVVLSPQALAILEEVRTYTGNGTWIFPSVSGHGPITESLRYGTRRIRKRSDLAPWTHHDLRRTATTALARLGVVPNVIEMMTAHAVRGVTMTVYNQYRFGVESAAGWDRLGEFVANLVGQQFLPAVAEAPPEAGAAIN